MHFDPVTYLAGELVNALPTLKKDGINNREVVILGSGPSVDHVDLSLVSDSIVVSLNSAHQLCKYCGPGNRYYWFCQDTKVAIECLPNVADEIIKLVTVHRFNRFFKIFRHLQAKDKFLQPKISFGRNRSGTSLLGLRDYGVRPLMNRGEPYLYDARDDRLTLFPSTVMLTAISLFGGLGAKRVSCLGFDLTPLASVRKKLSEKVNQSYISNSFPNEEISVYLKGLLEEMRARNRELVNCSPLTYERVLPRCDRFVRSDSNTECIRGSGNA